MTVFLNLLRLEIGKAFREKIKMDLEFYTVDVFSDKIFGGNPLAIFTNSDDISHDLMQSIASEEDNTFVAPHWEAKHTTGSFF